MFPVFTCKNQNCTEYQSVQVFPCVASVMESFFSDLLQAIISYWRESHLESFQKSTMEFFCENSQRLNDVYCLHKKAPQLFDWIPNTLRLESCCKCGVHVGCKCMGFKAAGSCAGKQLRLDGTIRELVMFNNYYINKKNF